MDAARKVESTGKEARAAKDSGKKAILQCKTCGKGHAGECRKATGCFLCGDTGHYKMDCPKRQQNPNGSQALQAATTSITTQLGRDADKSPVQVGREQPRLDALTQQGAETSNALVTGESHDLDPSVIDYASFEERVSRTVYIDNLSPLATEGVVKAALDQFGNVIQVKFIPNYLESKNIGRAALVELDNTEQVEKIISEVNDSPFMICGMPRPVRARAAVAEMFDDRPRKPGRRIVCRWLDSRDPDFEAAKKIKLMVRNHAEEAKFVLKCQLEEEEKLARRQAETLNATYKKYELIESVVNNRIATRLAECYRVRVADFEH